MASLPSSKRYDWTFRRVVWATLIFVLVALGVWIIYRFNQVIFLIFIAIVLGTVVRPAVAWLHRRKLPPMLAAILVYLLLILIVIGFALSLYPLVADQSGKITAALPGYYQGLREWLVNNPSQLIVRLGEFLPTALPVFTPVQQTGQQVLATAGQVLGYVSTAADTIFTFTAVLLLSFFWTLYGTRTIQSLLLLVPNNRRENISDLISVMETKLSSYLAGQAVLCLVIGAMALVAYLLIGLPNAFVLALVAGLMEAVPMVGPFLGAIPASIIALSISPARLFWVIGATVVIQQLENSLLVPRVHRKSVGVNPFVSLLAIFAFSSLFGIIGALMAIPMAAIIQLLLDRFVFHSTTLEPDVSTGRDLASRLRYEAQELAQGMRTQARLSKVGSDRSIRRTDQLMDEIEAITTDLDALLAEVISRGEP